MTESGPDREQQPEPGWWRRRSTGEKVVGILLAIAVLWLIVILTTGMGAVNDQTGSATTATTVAVVPTGTSTATIGSPGTTTAGATTTTPTNLVGEATITDKTGDVADPAGVKPPDSAVLAGRGDLLSVTMKADGTQVALAFKNATAPPAALQASSLGGDEYISWYVISQLSNGDRQYQLKAELVGTKWTLSVLDFSDGKQSEVTGQPTIADDTLSVSFPIETMPHLAQATGWWAGTEWSSGADTFQDFAPDGGGKSPDEAPWR
jgi:hypothetical protein